jgi:hypothetical protein
MEKVESVSLKEYEKGDKVQIHMQIGNEREWRDGVVHHTTDVYWEGGPRHPPYTMVFVEAIRTYWDSVKEEWYDSPNMEGFSYRSDVRLISKLNSKNDT